jgi:RNA polymerase sigma factor (sigma-70 family)
MKTSWDETLALCLARAKRWRTPPNWSVPDWHDELFAHAAAAGCQAEAEFDPSRNVPFCAFAYQRIMARLLTRYRQEWSYGLRNLSADDDAPQAASDPPASLTAKCPLCADRFDCAKCREPLLSAVASLSPEDRALLQELWWQEKTEAEVARRLGVSQQAVNKRKRSLLKNLRRRLESSPQP